jgi:hypothetical protein
MRTLRKFGIPWSGCRAEAPLPIFPPPARRRKRKACHLSSDSSDPAFCKRYWRAAARNWRRLCPTGMRGSPQSERRAGVNWLKNFGRSGLNAVVRGRQAKGRTPLRKAQVASKTALPGNCLPLWPEDILSLAGSGSFTDNAQSILITVNTHRACIGQLRAVMH